VLLIPKIDPPRSKKYRQWIASLNCAITGSRGECQCCHISRVGMGMKSSDYRTIPLNFKLHDEQTKTGSEVKFWAKYGKTMQEVDELANALNVVQYDDDRALMILAKFRRGVTCTTT